MDTFKVVNELRAERDRINQVIAALEAMDSTTSVTRTILQPQAGRKGSGGKRSMSAAARRKISEAAKKRWAAQKSKTANPQASRKQAGPNLTAPKRGMSATARKRLSEMMKKRWAARKKGAAKRA